MILAAMNAIYEIAYMQAWKIQNFNVAWTRDLAIPVRRSNQQYLIHKFTYGNFFFLSNFPEIASKS